ncbi:MAG: transcription initiation factor IIB family protein [Sulfolobaceae archaeon]
MMCCPNCGSSALAVIDGRETCTSCGFVIEEYVIDEGPEWRAYTPQDRLERERTGAGLTPKVHDRGLYTDIGRSRGSRISSSRLLKMKMLQRKIRVSSSDRKIVTYLSELNNECSKLGLPERIKETAATILRKVVEAGGDKRLNKTALILVTIFYACRVMRYPIDENEIIKRYGLTKSDIWNPIKRVQMIVKSNSMFHSRISPKDYIPKIVSKLGLPQYIVSKSAELVEKMHSEGLTSGKGYIAISAASVYLMSTLFDNKKTQKEVADVVNITEVTVRNRYRDIIEKFDIEVYI